MRRRHILSGFAVASLLLLAATFACWLAVNHAYHRVISAELLSQGAGQDQVWAMRAKVGYVRVRGSFFSSADVNMPQNAAPFFRRTDYPGGGYAVAIGIPYWLIGIASMPCPLLWFAGVLRRRTRRGPALCLTCGYDLRATPVRCPECGTEVTETPVT